MTTYPECWVYDDNRRIYRKDDRGRSYGSPIYREHWRKVNIVGQNRVSWLLEFGGKVPKKGGYGIAFSEEEVDRDVWKKENAYRIAELTHRQPYEVLKQIAELIGYTEATKDSP